MIELILQQITITRIVALVAVGLLGWYIADYVIEDRKIKALGHRAPVRPSWFPLQVDTTVDVIRHAQRNEMLEFWNHMFDNYGNPVDKYTIECRPAGRRLIFTADPENIKAILATQFQDFGKGEQFNKEWHDFLGDSIFTTDGKRWHDSRQLIRPQFIKDRVSDLEIFETHVNVLLSKFGGHGENVEVSDLFFRYTLDAATDFLLGTSVDSLSQPVVFAEAFNEVQRVQIRIAQSGPLNVLIPRKTFRKNLKIIDSFIKPYIDRVVALSSDELNKEEGYTFLHALAGYTNDRTVLRDQLYAVLIAGRDTTACTLSWTIYELSRQPAIVSKLRQEILNVVGPSRPPTYADLKSMRYLQHIMNETLRIYPVVPYNVRVALHDTTIPRGGGPNGDEPVGVPKDTPIAYSTLVMQRREDIYPPESSGFAPAREFVPERWDSWTPKSWTYVPFNGGPRICIGQQFALTEMGYTLVRIFQRYSRLESTRPGQAPGLKSDIVLSPAAGVHVAFWEASSTEK
ncbi:cytochrome P450 52A5 [Rhizodiscina lignyota]|uniref:Cytochrome P450 52A5 n=1 Tax=Rhizodiscina lignyota TaxID=1504668 RepID=A0A9P4M9D2_9PEZI|nr:cytochrome P450 52A5 [Rhizodiscina lignyota]